MSDRTEDRSPPGSRAVRGPAADDRDPGRAAGGPATGTGARRCLPGRTGSAVLAGLLLLGLPVVASPPRERPDRLADALRHLYPSRVQPWERWRRHPRVRLSDGREVPRDEAHRDDPDFVAAARRLLSSPARDDAALGAWLLGTVGPEHSGNPDSVLIASLGHPDRGAAFEATLALATREGTRAVEALEALARSAPFPELRTAAAWAARESVRRARGEVDPPRPVLSPDGAPPLGPAFRRGVSWWLSEGRGDAGRSSFRRLVRLGVTWVSIHTWDPLQRATDEPRLAPPTRHFGVLRLGPLVRSAHEAGLQVLFKPHLEMRGDELTPEERRILRGPDEAARRRLREQLEARHSGADRGDHNRLAMRSESDWRKWFSEYAAYILPHARSARTAGADMFCVGRELDSTVIGHEADWRRLIARIRAEFPGPLVYSANFDTWSRIGFWDTLDFIGVSAYFPLADGPDPSVADLEAGWARALRPLEEASRRLGKPVLLIEAGFPSVASAARAPWREESTVADVWLQSRCYEATLRAVADRPFVEGVFFWLWEGSSEPPFRDPSHTIIDKPASFTMARWYSAR